MKTKIVAAWIAGILALIALGAAGCGDDGGGDGGEGGTTEGGEGAEDTWPELPPTSLVAASHLSVDDALAAAAGGCLDDAVKTAGGTPVAAGRTEGSSQIEALWVAAESGGSEKAAVQVCVEGSCSCAVVEFSEAGASATPTGGTDGALHVVGRPLLAKTLTSTELSGPTELAAASGTLLDGALPSLDPARFEGKRRFVVASAYGPAFGVSLAPIVQAAEQSGLFTEAREHPYVQAGHIDGYLRDLHAQDVLIWFGAGVRSDKGATGFKPEGMTVNRGVYGDQTYDRERLQAALAPALLGGPGVLVLAGSETFGSAGLGLGAFGSQNHLIKSAGARPRVVVGFEGTVEPRAAMRAVRALTVALTDREALSAALASANAALQSEGSSAKMVSNLDEDDAGRYVLPPAIGDYWDGEAPASAQFVGNVLIGASTQCTPEGGGASYNPVEKSVQFFADVTFDGPFFSGSKSEEDADFEVFGVLGGLHQGGQLRFWVRGSRDDVHDITVLGDGRFCADGECSGDVTPDSGFGPGNKLYFAGPADGSAFELESGDTCNPFGMSLTQKGGKPGWILFAP
jgi:hypothetical protein